MTTAADRAANYKVAVDTLARIGDHKGVVGYMVLHPRTGHMMSAHGFGGDKDMIESYREKLFAFMQSSHSVVRTIDHSDALTFLRMRWRQREIIIAPDYRSNDYVLIVVHDHKISWKSGLAQMAEATGTVTEGKATGHTPTDAQPPSAPPAPDQAA